MTPDFRRASEQSISSLVHPSAPDDVRSELVEMGARVGPRAFVRQNRAMMDREDIRPVLSRIDIPTAVLVAHDDRITPVALSEEIHALPAGSTLHILRDCGHLPPIEKPEVTAILLERLLAR